MENVAKNVCFFCYNFEDKINTIVYLLVISYAH